MTDDKLFVYNALDGACTFEIRDAIWDDIKADGYGWTYAATIRLFEPLIFMMTRGIKINHEALAETKQDIQAASAAAQAELNKLAGRELNAQSPKQVQTYFYVEKGIDPYRGKDGQITADDKALARIARGTARRPGMREARLIQDIRGYEKLLGSYMEIAFDPDDRLRAAINPRGTKFGRFSTGKTVFGTGCNLQAMPQEFKKFLVPDDGYFFMEKDKRQAEWVVVAYISGDARMLHVIENGLDPHVYTGAMMLREQLPPDLQRQVTDKDLEDIVRLDSKVIGMLTDADEILQRRMADKTLRNVYQFLPRTMSIRQCGKKANHGLNYDEQYRMFALMNEIQESEAMKIIKLYHRIYSGIQHNFHAWVKQQLSKSGRTLTNCFGRRIRFLDEWGPDLYKSAYSALPQSTVVDGLNIGFCDIYEDDYITRTMNLDILAQTHDSLLFQVPITVLTSGKLYDVSRSIDKYLSPTMEYGGRKFTIATDTKVGWNWSGMHKDRNPLGLQELPECRSKLEFNQLVHHTLGIRQGSGVAAARNMASGSTRSTPAGAR